MEYNIKMNEYSFTPDSINLMAGICYQINFENNGKETHEFAIGKNASDNGFQQNLLQNISVDRMVNGKEVTGNANALELKPGEKGSMTFTIPSDQTGQWQFASFTKTNGKTNYSQGMKGTLNVR